MSRATNHYASPLLATVAKKPFHERHLAKSGFGKSKAAKLDNPAECRVRERGATAAVLGDEGKAVGESASRRLCCLRYLQQTYPPAASRHLGQSKLDACYVVRDHDGQQLSYVYFEEEPGLALACPRPFV